MKRVFLIVLDSCGVGYEPDAADFGDVFGDRHKNSSFCLDWEPEFTLKKGQRKAYAPLPFLRHAVAAAAFSGFMGARVEMACL